MSERATDAELEKAYLGDLRVAPWLYINMVTTIDGAITIDGRSSTIGDAQDLVVFRALRAVADVVLVAAATAREEGYKKPRLPDHLIDWRRRRGLPDLPRVALVSSSLSFDLEPFDDAPPIVITDESSPRSLRSDLESATDVFVAGRDRVDLRDAVERLRANGFGRILSEGGPSLNGQLAAGNLVDEWCLTVAPLVVGGDSKRIAVGPTVEPGDRTYRLDRAMSGETSLFSRWIRSDA